MISEISPRDVITYCRTALGISTNKSGIDDVLLSGLLRRCAGILCPCSRTALRIALTESLIYLDTDSNALAKRLGMIVDNLIVSGDLLELSEVTTDDPDVRGTWVFAAPPSFVVRPSGSVFLSGIVPDQDAFLPESLDARIVYSRCTRHILPKPGEDLAEILSSAGLIPLPEKVWLKAPKALPPEELLKKFKQQLAAQKSCGPINGLKILDPARKVTYYRGRWTEPATQTGTFVAQRPQEFGTPGWCFVELAEGTPRRLLDLPSSIYHRWRGCDAAWHLQMAIDHCRKQPQQYLRCDTDNGARFYFYSPLPLWAQRRLMLFGHECPRKDSLFAYEISAEEADEEEQYLRGHLWLTLSRTPDSGGNQ